MFKLPLNDKNILTAMSLNKETIQHLLKVGFKPYNLAGRVVYSDGEIRIVNRDTVPPVHIPKLALHDLTNIEFVDGGAVMDMVYRLNTVDSSTVCGSGYDVVSTVTIITGDRVLSFQMPDCNMGFTSPKTETAFNELVAKLDSLGVGYELRYRPMFGCVTSGLDLRNTYKVNDDIRTIAHYIAVEGSGRPDHQIFTFRIGDPTIEELSGNLMVFNVLNTCVSCVVDDEYLQSTALLVGKDPKELLGIINQRFARQIDAFIVELCYNLDIVDTNQLLELLNEHI